MAGSPRQLQLVGRWLERGVKECFGAGSSLMSKADGQSLTGVDAALEHLWHEGCGPAMEQLWPLSGMVVPGGGQCLFPP